LILLRRGIKKGRDKTNLYSLPRSREENK